MTKSILVMPVTNVNGEYIGAFQIINKMGENGFDEDCFKQWQYLVPLEGPYYAFMTALNTDGAFGGVKVNHNIQAYAKDGGLMEKGCFHGHESASLLHHRGGGQQHHQ